MATKTAATPKAAPAAKAAAPAAAPKKANALQAPMKPSADLAAIVGANALPRTEITKKVWDYIKAHNLQDAANKRAINADAKLKKVVGKDQVTMFELTGLVSKHMTKA